MVSIPMRDADRRRFVELAGKRVSKALHDIQLIGNLSNRSNYDYREEDVARIFKALNAEVRSCKRRFELALGNKNHSRFSLED